MYHGRIKGSRDGKKEITKKRRQHAYPDCIKGASLESTWSFNGVSMHRVTNPSHYLTCSSNSPDQIWEFHSHILSPHSGDHSDSSRSIVRIQDINEFH